MVRCDKMLGAVRLRPGFGGTAFARFATMKLSWLAQPKLAKQAKAGGRTLDLSRVKGTLSLVSPSA
jgi:hypothetical protein